MWKGQGRSGYGDSATVGDYDDWSCLSRNGRQWKNPSTMLTRDLSGADYWHVRKQITDSYDVPLEIYAENDTVNLSHTLPNGKANLLAYADPVVRTKKSTKIPLKQRIIPQLSRLDKLNAEILELEKAYRSGEYSPEEYTILRNVAFARKERAEVLYKKAINTQRATDKDEEEYYTNSYDNSPSVSDKEVDTERRNSPQFSASNKGIVAIKVPRDLIYFLTSSVVVLVLLKILV